MFIQSNTVGLLKLLRLFRVNQGEEKLEPFVTSSTADLKNFSSSCYYATSGAAAVFIRGSNTVCFSFITSSLISDLLLFLFLHVRARKLIKLITNKLILLHVSFYGPEGRGVREKVGPGVCSLDGRHRPPWWQEALVSPGMQMDR